MLKKRLKKKQKGFTLIELLLVISIISFISSIIFVSLYNARVKSRDIRRVSDLKQIAVALESFYSDKGHYPNTLSIPGVNNSSGSCFDCTLSAMYDRLIYDLSGTSIIYANIGLALSTYLPTPKDPLSSHVGASWGYNYYSDGKDYKLVANHTVEDYRNVPANMIDPNRCGGFDPNTGICNVARINTFMRQSIGIWTQGGLLW